MEEEEEAAAVEVVVASEVVTVAHPAVTAVTVVHQVDLAVAVEVEVDLAVAVEEAEVGATVAAATKSNPKTKSTFLDSHAICPKMTLQIFLVPSV